MPFSFERKLPIVLTFVFFMLTTIGIFSFQSTVSIQDELRIQRQSRDVIVRLDRILTNSVEADSELLGFVTTGNASYLELLPERDKQVAEDLGQLGSLVAEDPLLSSDLTSLRNAISQKATARRSVIELRRITDMQTTVGKMPTLSSRDAYSDFRSAIQRMKDREMNLIYAHEMQVDRDMGRTIMILIVASLAGVVALVLANFIVIIENNRRRDAESGLRKANEDLEEKVKERTNELEAANANLLRSAAEREDLLSREQAARRDAEIANRLRDEFMATVSHELRTPLNSILGWARLMRSGNLDPRQSARAVKTIIKNSESQNRLIEDLLDVARMISGKLELDVRDVYLHEFVEYSVESAKPEAARRNIVINLQMEDTIRNSIIVGDKLRLEQIVGNLLTNAIKFSRPDSAVDVKAYADGAYAEIAVTDRGTGISKEFLPFLFERFRQDRSTIKQSGGLGLGLSVVRNLTDLHGGSVAAFSEGKNKGSTFTVRLPIKQA